METRDTASGVSGTQGGLIAILGVSLVGARRGQARCCPCHGAFLLRRGWLCLARWPRCVGGAVRRRGDDDACLCGFYCSRWALCFTRLILSQR